MPCAQWPGLLCLRRLPGPFPQRPVAYGPLEPAHGPACFQGSADSRPRASASDEGKVGILAGKDEKGSRKRKTRTREHSDSDDQQTEARNGEFPGGSAVQGSGIVTAVVQSHMPVGRGQKKKKKRNPGIKEVWELEREFQGVWELNNVWDYPALGGQMSLLCMSQLQRTHSPGAVEGGAEPTARRCGRGF